jgi:radial spoke head protein 9
LRGCARARSLSLSLSLSRSLSLARSLSLSLSPPLRSSRYADKCAAVSGLFKGDPSFPLEEPPEEAPDAEEGVEVESFREIHRLSWTVARIDHDVSVVPVNSWIASAAKSIVENKSYTGLSHGAAGELRNYLHFRAAESPLAQVSLEKPGLSRAGDIFDPLDADKPKGCWTISYNDSATAANLKSLYWPGYFFFQTIGVGEYGGVYMGNGQPNTDLAFAL